MAIWNAVVQLVEAVCYMPEGQKVSLVVGSLGVFIDPTLLATLWP